MALGAVLASALNTAAARKWGIYIDGLDVAATPAAAPGNRPGVSVDSVTVTEAGSGQVSSMEFTIEDPAGEISIAEGQFVRYADLVRDMPLFAGWIEDCTVRRKGTGRSIAVKCVGIEALLDWGYVPVALTIAAGTDWHGAQAAIVAATFGLAWPLNTTYVSGSQGPLASPFRGPFSGTTLQAETVGPGSLRDCLQSLWDQENAAAAASGGGYDRTTRWFLTIDFWGGIRANWQTVDPVSGMTTIRPPDYVGVTLDTSTATRPSNTEYGITASAVGGVYVKGTGAGARYVTRGVVGPVATTGGTAITTGDGASAAAESYFARRGVSRHGQVTAEGNVSVGSPSAQVRAGSPLTVIDPQVGLPAPGFLGVITEIQKTWASSGEETWVIAFGGTDPRSGTELLGALTKGVRV